MSRFSASGLHLSVCIAVATLLLVLFWSVWYRAPLMDAAGGTQIFLMLLAVDVVLGPLLTLVVYKQEKKTLKFDLVTIGLLQIAALLYGVYTLLVARPVYVAALGHRFDLVHANEIDEKELLAAQKKLPRFGPQWTGTKTANDPKEKERVMFSALFGADYGHYPQHHQPLENMRDEILKNAQPISDLKKENPGDEEAIDRWLEKRGVKAEEVIYQGLKARAKDMAVIMDAKTAKVIGIAPFKPWP
jgi:hypothetical protein